MLLALQTLFGGTIYTDPRRRIAVAIEDAGFDIRDCLCWLYGSGFPKSHDVAKAIDKRLGVEGGYGDYKTPDHAVERAVPSTLDSRPWHDDEDAVERNLREYLPGSEQATAWQGWGTALKPAFEPIVLARKPLDGTVAANVLAHGVGALHVDACRIQGAKGDGNWKGRDLTPSSPFIAHQADDYGEKGNMELGRWPANVILDEDAAEMLDEQTGTLTSGRLQSHHKRGGDSQVGTFNIRDRTGEPCDFGGDSGGASRFFYVAKASRAERNAGLDGFDEGERGDTAQGLQNMTRAGSGKDYGTRPVTMRNVHPTVKPIEVMRWLIRLVTPPGGLVVDPFTGSGSTGCACAVDGVRFLGVEEDATYVPIADARIAWWALHGEDGFRLCSELEAGARRRAAVEDVGQLDIFA